MLKGQDIMYHISISLPDAAAPEQSLRLYRAGLGAYIVTGCGQIIYYQERKKKKLSHVV